MLAFEPKQPVKDVEEKILIEGKEVGRVFPYVNSTEPETKFQAQLFCGLCYPGGFGPTKEDAIKAAIIEGWSQYQTLHDCLVAVTDALEG